jgi:quercetin dioxygenase-like cupin family protein
MLIAVDSSERGSTTMKWAQFPDRIRALEPFSQRFDAFRLRAESCDVLFATYPAGTVIEPHNHDTDNWGVITKGEMIIRVDGRETHYRPGEWYHVPAGTVHAARCSLDTEEIEFWFAPR